MSLEKLLEAAKAAETLEAYEKNLAAVVDAAHLRRLRELANKPLKLADVVKLLTIKGYVKSGSRGHWDIYSNNGSQMAVMPKSKLTISRGWLSKETYAVLVRTLGPNQYHLGKHPVSEQELLKIENAHKWHDRLNSPASPLVWLPPAVMLAGGAIFIANPFNLAPVGAYLAMMGTLGGMYLYTKGTANKDWIDIQNKAHSIGMNAVRGLLAESPG